MLHKAKPTKNTNIIFAVLFIFYLLKTYDKYIMTTQARTYAHTIGSLSSNKMRKSGFLFH
jgi:hypothetical protein